MGWFSHKKPGTLFLRPRGGGGPFHLVVQVGDDNPQKKEK